ncbi:MAG: hypothetical protein VYB73_06630 [Verrucomicrobiota bacterium]|nr:hypothetical protein [Verrucomicrobiota bacterium]
MIFNRLTRIHIAALAIILVATVSSCVGYKLGNNKPTHLQGVNSVSVPIFKNETLEPRLQSLATNATIKALQQSGAYLISKPSNSDATLHATIKSISRRQLRATRENVLRTKEIEFIIEVTFFLEDNRTGRLLDKGSVEGNSTSYLDSNFQLTKRQSIQLAANDLAKKISARMSEGF